MSEEVKPDKIKKTQESLSKYIKKPPLTEKLLKKPPFRFLHDIVTSVMKETGLLEGVFQPEQLNTENIKDRDAKMDFLNTLISNLKSITGSQISAKPSKMIAGLEVNKTLDLLIILAKAIEIKKGGGKANEKTTALSKDLKKPTTKGSKDNKQDSDSKKKTREESRGRVPGDKTKQKKNDTKPSSQTANVKVNGSETTLQTQEISSVKPEDSVSTKEQKLSGRQISNEEKTVVPTNDTQPDPNISNSNETNNNPRKTSARQLSDEKLETTSRVTTDGKTLTKERKSSSRRRSSIDNVNQNVSSVIAPQSLPSTGEEQDSSLQNEDVGTFSANTVKTALPDKMFVGQISTESNSYISSEPTDRTQKTSSPEVNGEATSHEKNRKGSSKPDASNNHQNVAITSNTSNDMSKEPQDKVKIKRPQSAKMRPGSSRQRKVDEIVTPYGIQGPNEDPALKGQVVLGEGEVNGVIGSAPMTNSDGKGRRLLSGRPSSSRPGAPKPRDRGQVNIDSSNANNSNNGDDLKTVAVIEDKNETEDDQDLENLVTLEKEEPDLPRDLSSDKIESSGNLDESNQGALVSQILETKKELEDTDTKLRLSSLNRQQRSQPQEWDVGRLKSRREATARDIEKLRDSIQTVTRSSAPLGKLFDFLQEDVELMQTELQEWIKTNARLQKDIQLQAKQTDDSLSPLSKQLSELDLLIEHEQESIRRIKSNIHLNSTKLDNLLKINNT